MATIVLLEHRLQDRLGIHYMAHEFLRPWEAMGHRVIVHRGLASPPPGDIAFVHVDLTVIPDSYMELARRYSRVVNGATADIRKSRYSECLLAREDAWEGPVIIKTEANHGGHVDEALRRMALEAGLASDLVARAVMDNYYLCRSMREVPGDIWTTPGVIVEKFLPERDERGSYIRFWTFFGAEERSYRYRAAAGTALIRFADLVDREPVPVPDEIRAARERLGFDFGKFDYVEHDGRYFLLDANRTPGAPSTFTADATVRASLDRLATAIGSYL